MKPDTHPIQCPASVRGKPASRSGRSAAFSMIELLVVVMIVVLVAGVSYPILGALMRGNRIEAGLNTNQRGHRRRPHRIHPSPNQAWIRR